MTAQPHASKELQAAISESDFVRLFLTSLASAHRLGLAQSEAIPIVAASVQSTRPTASDVPGMRGCTTHFVFLGF